MEQVEVTKYDKQVIDSIQKRLGKGKEATMKIMEYFATKEQVEQEIKEREKDGLR